MGVGRAAHTPTGHDMTLTAPGIAPPATTTTGSIPAPTAPPAATPAIEVTGPLGERFEEILTPEALAFLAALHHRFGGRRHDRLPDRQQRRCETGTVHHTRFHDAARPPTEEHRGIQS